MHASRRLNGAGLHVRARAAREGLCRLAVDRMA